MKKYIVTKREELDANIKTLDKYLNSKTDPEYSCALDLVKRGICFVAVKDKDTYRFYPSRFLGYMDNSMADHMNNEYRDGRVTNEAISEILGCAPEVNLKLEKLFHKYCEQLGFMASNKGAFGRTRKYWEVAK